MITGAHRTKIREITLRELRKDTEAWWEYSALGAEIREEYTEYSFTDTEFKRFLKYLEASGDIVFKEDDDDYISLPEDSGFSFSSSTSQGSTESIEFWRKKCEALNQVNRSVKEELKATHENVEKLNTEVKELKDQAKKKRDKIVEIRIKRGPKTVKSTKGVFHSEFPKIVSLLQAGRNVLLWGPTGTGKTHTAMMIAEVMKYRKFAFSSFTSGTSESRLVGNRLPIGEKGEWQHVMTEFLDVFENGGLFLMDEMDRADPNVLTIMNAALANGKVSIPTRPDKPYAVRHKDCAILCACNTIGTGADRMYTAANKLDASTLNRFWKVFVDYDTSVEEQLCPDEDLRKLCWNIRAAIKENSLEQAMTTRFMIEAYDLKTNDYGYQWSHKEIELCYFQGWPRDQFEKVYHHLQRSGTPLNVTYDDIQARSF